MYPRPMTDSQTPDSDLTTFRCGRCDATLEHRCPAPQASAATELLEAADTLCECLGNLDARTAGRLEGTAKRLRSIAGVLAPTRHEGPSGELPAP